MKGRLKDGDLAMCIKHSGDCFWYYQLVDNDFSFYPQFDIDKKLRRGYRLIKESNFGAYTLGDAYEFQPTDREFHLLMAGERTALEADKR
jgi:hypothetical protein